MNDNIIQFVPREAEPKETIQSFSVAWADGTQVESDAAIDFCDEGKLSLTVEQLRQIVSDWVMFVSWAYARGLQYDPSKWETWK
jgi:hypothetical protein